MVVPVVVAVCRGLEQKIPQRQLPGLLAARADVVEQRRVDPRSKVLVFSDGLDIAKVMRLYDYFRGRCQVAFGVGTHLTNDLGPTPLNIVIKMVRCNGQPVAKLSDSPGKSMCDDPGYLAYLRQVFELPQPV